VILQTPRDSVPVAPVIVQDLEAGLLFPTARHVAEIRAAHTMLVSSLPAEQYQGTYRRFPVEHSGQKYFVNLRG
jgi:hypothetical protein